MTSDKHQSMRAVRSAVIVTVVGVVIATTSAVLAGASDPKSVPGEEYPVENVDGQLQDAPTPIVDRDEAALYAEDLRSEVARLDAARASFADSLYAAPDTKSTVVVSLQRPIKVADFLGKATTIDVTQVFTWIHLPGSLYPKVGQWSVTQGDGELAAGIQRETETYLAERAAHVEALAKDGSISASAAADQLAEARELLAFVETNGVEMYGFTCVCSPTEIIDASSGLAFDVRAVEDESSGFTAPVWPENPLRDSALNGG